MYLMFIGPFSQGGDFIDSGIEGMHRFLRRVWTLLEKSQISNLPPKARLVKGGKSQILDTEDEGKRFMSKTIKKVSDDVGDLKYNTAIASLMEWYNFLIKRGGISKEEAEAFLKLLAPFAPHMTEELWESFRSQKSKVKSQKFESIHLAPWPSFDEKYLEENEVSIAVSVNGKTRDVLRVEKSKVKSQKAVEQLARGSDKVKKYLEGKKILKTIYVEGKIINFVIG